VLPLTDAGIGLRATGRIRATERWSAPSEFRRRLVAALDAAGLARHAVTRPPGSATPDRPTTDG
jgi:hypothetical protein